MSEDRREADVARSHDSGRLLVVTNDFPPRPGGIQSFVHGVVARLPREQVVVLTSRWRDWEDWDATQDYRIVRHDSTVLLPTPGVRRHAVELFREAGCTDVWFGAAAPLGLLAPALRAAGARRLVATTHGHEAGWASLPAARALLRRIGREVDVVTYLGDYTRRRLAAALGPAADRLQRLVPAVDIESFSPTADGAQVRARLGLAGRPVVVCVSRLMPRKGQDTLIRALPLIHRTVPDAALLLVGGGPSRSRLQRLAEEHAVAPHVVFAGSVGTDRLPAYYRAGDVFAMPCRDRLRGLDVEGLGMVYLEAAGCGLAVLAGASGGAPDAVRDGKTGIVVDGRDVAAVADRLAELLRDRGRAAAMGEAGREWVRQEWTWERTVSTLRSMLDW